MTAQRPQAGPQTLLCPICAAANPLSARFCANCGSALPVLCPVCQFPNPGENRFCMNCGSGLQEKARRPAGTESRPPVNSPQPPEEIFSGERRIVTILFADVVDSTSLAENMDPEDWRGLMNEAFSRLTLAITQSGGTIARLMGDAVLAFFGAPAAHEDDPIRAVRAGLEMVSAAREFSLGVRQQYGVDINIRVGIHTGPVVVGLVGSEHAREYTAMGDAVNLAARLQGAARPMTVLVSEPVYRRVMPFIQAEDQGEIQIKGKSDAVRVFEIEGFQLDATVNPLMSTTFIGRERELALLIAANSALRAGLSRAAIILGDPGIGKTRLVQAWRESIYHDPTTIGHSGRWLEGHCPSFGQDTAYHLVTDLLYNLLQLPQGAPAFETQNRLREICSRCLPAGDQEGYRFLAHLLSLPLDPADLQSIEMLGSQAVQFKYLTHIHRLLAGMASLEPVHLILDDIHWADPSSVQLLAQLLPLLQGDPVLICCISRPELDTPGWSLLQAIRELYGQSLLEIKLEPLNPTESLRMVGSILQHKPHPDLLPGTIYEKAEGNPLFTEQVIRMLVDQGALKVTGETWDFATTRKPFEIPDQLHGLLMARIDRLPEDARRVLRYAAVIGRSFSVPVLGWVVKTSLEASHLPGLNISRILAGMEAAGLVTLSQVAPQLQYSFRHSLVQEAVYDSLLKSDRRQMHRFVGETLETLRPDSSDGLTASLARHFLLAGEERRALEYLVQSADAAFIRYALTEARAAYQQAVEIILKHGYDSERLVHLYTRLGRVMELDSQYENALRLYQEMERTARVNSDQALHLSSILVQAALYAGVNTVNDSNLALSLSQEALTLSNQLNDRAAEAKAYWILLLLNSRSNRMEDAMRYGGKALALARELGLIELEAYILNDLSEAYFSSAKFEQAREAFAETQRMWRELGMLNMLSDNLATATLMHFLTGEFERGIQSSDEAYQISQSIGNLWGIAYSRMYVGYIYAECVEFGKAIEIMNRVIENAMRAGFLAPLVTTRADLAGLYGYIGHFERAFAEIKKAQEVARERLPAWETWVNASLARVQYYAGDLQSLEELIQVIWRDLEKSDHQGLIAETINFHAIDLDYATITRNTTRVLQIEDRFHEHMERGLKVLVPDLHYSMGVSELMRGNQSAAQERLMKGLILADEIGSQRSAWPILAALGKISEAQGMREDANRYTNRLEVILEKISLESKTAGSPVNFRSLPWVQRVLTLDIQERRPQS